MGSCHIRHNRDGEKRSRAERPEARLLGGVEPEGSPKVPEGVRSTFGQALYDAQTGGKHPGAKPLRGFGGAGVLEVVEEDDGKTYRAVYTVKFVGVVYVLHAFQKKSKSGIRTPAEEIEKVRSRLKEATKHHAEWVEEQENQDPP